jgi:hypothetical protein
MINVDTGSTNVAVATVLPKTSFAHVSDGSGSIASFVAIS